MRIQSLTFTIVFALLSLFVNGQTNSFSENFEHTSNVQPLPAGWDGTSDYVAGPSGKNNNYLWRSTALTRTNNHENVAGRCAALSANNTNTVKARLKSPVITLSSTKYAKLKFKLRNATQAGALGDFSVFVSTDGGTTYLNNPIVQHISTGNVWQDYEYSLAQFLGQQIVLVFEGASSGSSAVYYYFLDNVEISDAPSCQTPIFLMTNSISDNTATIAWSLDPQYGSIPNAYSIQLKNNSGALLVDSTGYVTVNNSFNFVNLTENTTYIARVMSDCSDAHKGTSEWQEVSFTTTSSPKPLPMVFDFDTLNSLPVGSISHNATLFSATASTTDLVYGGSGKSLRISSSVSDYSYFILPPANVTADSIEVDMKIKSHNGTSVPSMVRYQVGYVTDLSDIQSYFVPVFIDSVANGSDWKSIFFNTANLGDATNPVSICVFIDAGQVNYIYVDDIEVHYLPACRRPEGLAAYYPTSSSITVNWDYATTSSVLVRANALDGTFVIDTAMASPFVLSGLSANTVYNVVARTLCGNNDSSHWTPPIQIRTQCQQVATTLSEDFEMVGSNQAPECWRMGLITKPSASTVVYPFSPTGQSAHSGTQSMSFVAQESGTVAYISSPLMSFAQSGMYDVSLWIYRKSIQAHANERIEIWATPLENSTAGGTLLGTCYSHFAFGEAESTVGWYNYQYNITVQGDYHVTFVCYGEGASIEFDDVEVVPAPDCRNVKRLRQGKIGVHEIDLLWSQAGDANQWIVDYKLYRYGTTDTLPVRDTTIVSSVPSAQIDNLASSTQYGIWAKVRTICSSSDTADGVELYIPFVQTRCEPIDTLPYMTGFEAYDQNDDGANPLPQCWLRLTDGQNDNFYPYNYLSSSFARNGNQCLYFYSHIKTSTSTFPSYQTAIMPAVDTTRYPINQLKIKFSAKRVGTETNDYPELSVGVMSDPDDVNTFTLIDNVNISSGTYADYTVKLAPYTGSGIYPAFMFASGSEQQEFVIDDVRIEKDNNCNDISGGVFVSNVKSNSVQVRIIDITVSDWQISCCTQGQMPDAGIMTNVNGIMDTMINGLSAETNYIVYVRRVCGTEYGSWSVGESFRTKCPSIRSYPYFEDFEGHEIGLLGGCYDVTSTSTGELKVMQQSSTAVMGEIYNHTPGGLKGLMCSDPSSPSQYYPMSGVFTISKIFHLKPGKQYSVSFWAKQFEYYSNYTWKCTIKYGLSPSDLIPVQTFTVSNKTFNLFNAVFTVPGEEDYYISFVTESGDNNTQYYPQIDDITIDELSCAVAGNLVVGAVTQNSLSISYTNNGQLWQFALSNDSTRAGGYFANPIYYDTCTQNSVTINGLLPNTDYYCMARNICAAGDTSKWSDVEVVHTKCTVMSLPHSDSFERDDELSCWSMIAMNGQNTVFTRSNTKKIAGYSSLKFNNCLAVSPEYAVDSLNHCFLRGWALSENDNASIAVQVMYNPDDISTSSDPIDTIVIPEKNKWYEFVVYFDNLSLPEFEDYKYSKHINFHAGSTTVYMDSIVVEAVGNCMMPYDAQISNVTTNSFDISFTEHGSATEWIVSTNGIAHTITENPATITGLAPATEYNVTLASSCYTSSTSYPFYCGTIRTECGIMSLPWSTSFEQNENYFGLSYHEGELEEKCWITYDVKAGGDSYPYYYMTTKNALSGKQSLDLYNSINATADKMYLVLPQLAGQSNNLHWKLHYLNSSEDAPILEMGYLTDATDKNTFVILRSLPAVTEWTVAEILTSTATSMPATARLALRLVRTSGGGTVYVDDISVKQPRSCPDTELPVITSFTDSKANVSIIDTCTTHNHWQYCVGEINTDINTLTPVDVYADSFEITNLAPATDYYVYIRAVCGPGDVSNWTRLSFTTECGPVYLTPGIPFVDSFEDQLSSLPISGCYVASGYYDNNTCVSVYTNPVSETITYDYVRSGSNCLYAQSNRSYQPDAQTIYRKFYLEKGKVYKAGIYAHTKSAASDVIVLVGVDTTSMTIVDKLTIDQHSAVDNSYRPFWQYVGNYFVADSTAVYFIAIHGTYSGANSGSYIYYDDFTVEEIGGCIPPVATIISSSESSVTVMLSDTSDASAFQYRIVADNEEVVATTTVPSYLFTVPGLKSSTRYSIKVRRDCGNNNYSEWYSTDFATQCYAISDFPFTEDFEEGEFPPLCWTVTAPDTATWTRYSSASTGYCNGLGSAYMTAHELGDFALLSTPELMFNGNKEYVLNFKNTKRTSGDNKDVLEVYLSPSATSVDNATLLGVVKVTGAALFGMNDNSLEIPEGTNGRYSIVFKGISNDATYLTYLYIDDVIVEELPDCDTPDEISVVSVSSTSVTVYSKLNSEHSAVRFTCSNAGDTVTSPDCNGTYTFNGLSPDTEYELSVYGVCGPENTSVSLPAVKAKTTSTDCFAPKFLRTTGIITHNHASLTWCNSPMSTSTNYKLYSNGSLVSSGICYGDTILLDSLAESTTYTFSVSNYCSGDTTAWSSVNFTTAQYSFEIPFVCDFEDTQQNSHWQMRNLSGGPNWFIIGRSGNAVLSGSKALYVTNDGGSYSYTSLLNTGSGADAETLIQMAAGYYSVQYDWKCLGVVENSGYIRDYGRVFLVPTSTTIANVATYMYNNDVLGDVIQTDTRCLVESNSWVHQDATIEIPEDGIYRLVVIFANDAKTGAQPPLAIDNMSITRIDCMPVRNTKVVGITENSASLAIRKHDARKAIQYACLQIADADSVTEWQVSNEMNKVDTITFTGLQANTTYYLFSRHLCDSDSWSTCVCDTIHTPAIVANTPFVCSFEVGDPNLGSWMVTNGTSANTFVMGNATSTEGNRSLYVTNDGFSYNYSTASSSSAAYAYIPLNFEAGNYEITYDWKCEGEDNKDYARIFLAPLSMKFYDNQVLSGLSDRSLPIGCIPLDGGSELNLSSSWQKACYSSFNITNDNVYYLVIYWHNDSMNGAQPPFAIDNISVKSITCPRPEQDAISVLESEPHVVRLHIAGGATSPLRYVVSSNSQYSDTVASGLLSAADSVITVTGLASSTLYYVTMRYLCSESDSSAVLPYKFRTSCEIISRFPYTENFEEVDVINNSHTYDVLGDMCWMVESPVISTYYGITMNPNQTYLGSKALLADNGTSGSRVQTFALPLFNSLDGKILTLYYKNLSFLDRISLQIGYLSSPGDASSFISLYTTAYASDFTKVEVVYNDVPAGCRAAFRTNGTTSMCIDEIRVNDIASADPVSDMICNNAGYYEHGFNCSPASLHPGDTVLTRVAQSSVIGTADSIITVNLRILNDIVVTTTDTICEGHDYINGYWNLTRPTAGIYFDTYQSVYGCDSTVHLTLVTIPTHETRFDTICQGETYSFYGQNIATAGTYTGYTLNQLGCNDTITLHLHVVDTLLTTNASICEGDNYQFEGHTYSQAGTYKVVSTSIHGCSVTKVLNLTVISTDTTINVSICQGGRKMVVDTMITTAGNYVIRRVGALGCTVTYHINATINPLIHQDVYDYVCQGYDYTGNGLSGLHVTNDTVVVVDLRTTDQQCDSSVSVHITLMPSQHSDTVAHISSGGYITWHNETYTKAGDYQVTLTDIHGCDSVVTLHLFVDTDLDNANAGISIEIVPNPLDAGATALVHGDFNDLERVDILNSQGQLLNSFVPDSYPVEVQGINAAGVYYVRIVDVSGNVYTEKLIVR